MTTAIAPGIVTAMTTGKKKAKAAPVQKKGLLWLILGLIIGILLGIGGYWLYEEHEDSVEDFGEKTEDVGKRLNTWGKDVSKSTKKLFD